LKQEKPKGKRKVRKRKLLRKTKKQKKEKEKNTPRAGEFFKNSGCYAFLGAF
jgi:hypothetical protein